MSPKTRFATILIALCAGSTGASGQNDPQTATLPECPTQAIDLPVQALYGRWDVQFEGGWGSPAIGVVQLAAHPEYPGGVRGTIAREAGTAPAQLAGDVDDEGQLSLDESQDGVAISAVWTGDMQPGSCGKEFKGTWRNSKDDRTLFFTLRKQNAR